MKKLKMNAFYAYTTTDSNMPAFPDINLRDVDTSADQRLGELMLFVSQISKKDPNFGAVKLNKLLFFVDVMGFLQRNKTVSRSEFMKLDEGPAPRRLMPVRGELISEGRAKIVQEEMPPPFNPRERLVATSEPDMTIFDQEEVKIVEEQIKKFWEWNGKQLSVLTHKLPAWEIAQDREKIPIQAVLLKGFGASDAAKARSLQTARELGLE